MSKKTTAKKATKKIDAAEVKAAPEAKAAKEPKAKKEKAPREELCVFALRLREDERVKIHTTAGARNASQFARRVLVAFANEDVSAFKAVLDDAKTARQ